MTEALLAFGRACFTLDRPDADGVTQRDHLLKVQELTGNTPEELLDLPQLPDVCRHVWQWFGAVSRARQSGFGANPISYVEMDAWARLMHITLAPWEVEAIRALDDDLLRMVNEEQDKKAKAKNGR